MDEQLVDVWDFEWKIKQLTTERDELLGICRIMAGGGSLDDFNQAIKQAKVMVAKHKGGGVMNEQCSECGKTDSTDSLIETDVDGSRYICPDCWNRCQIDDFWLEQAEEDR